jgi:hypothetical protein
MSTTRCTASLAIAIIATALPCLALAWTPYGYGYGYGGGEQSPGTAPERGQPGGTPYPPSFPPYGPGGVPGSPYGGAWSGPGSAHQAPPYGGYGAPPGYPDAYSSISGPGYAQTSSFQVSRETTEDAYILDIRVQGIEPSELQVTPQGQWILIRSEISQRQLQEDSFDEGRGGMRSYSFSTGSASRRLTVPRDGDLSAMRREDGEDSVRIVIPRRGN